jgi:hypothetical protein
LPLCRDPPRPEPHIEPGAVHHDADLRRAHADGTQTQSGRAVETELEHDRTTGPDQAVPKGGMASIVGPAGREGTPAVA